jgi:hypothetical protein
MTTNSSAALTTQSFAQDRRTGATPAAGAKAGATQATFTMCDAIPWQPVDPKHHPGLEMFVVWGNPNEGASVILQKFPAGMDSVHHDKCEEGGDCIIAVYFHDKLDFKPVDTKAQ